jgi:mono/diheme cytochrome c family protein
VSRHLVLGALGAVLFSSACRGETTRDAPIVVEQNMYVQERVDPQSASRFFPDKGGMRPVVPDTIAEERFEDDETVATGLLLDGSGYVMTVPDSVVARAGGMSAMLHRGRERFDIYCAPCHGRTGDGKGMISRVPQGFPALPSLSDPRIQKLPDGQLFATIANGVRVMPAYAAQVPTSDRWAIVAYTRALELSQLASSGGPGR